MTRLGLMAMLALVSCSPATPRIMVPVASSNVGACRVGGDGGRLTDRGIGGTGRPAVRTSERGIGGTGIIGETGIIGVITGFGSVCVAGEEVALADDAGVEVDGTPASLGDLRAGHVVSLRATGHAGTLRTRAVAVRHVVIGPVEAIGPGRMTVAGQHVMLAVAPDAGIRPGEWVAVSGLPEPDGTIAATRIDPAPPGLVLLHGILDRRLRSARIGALAIRLPNGRDQPVMVMVTGRLRGGELVADSVAADTAAEGPAELFGSSVETFIVEGYVARSAGGYLVGGDFVSGGAGGVKPGDRSIATFTRRPGGALVSNGLRSADGSADATGRSQRYAPDGVNLGPGGLFDEARPGEGPDHARSDHARPDHARPDHARPDQARPNQARPDHARPDQARPDQTGRPHNEPGAGRGPAGPGSGRALHSSGTH